MKNYKLEDLADDEENRKKLELYLSKDRVKIRAKAYKEERVSEVVYKKQYKLSVKGKLNKKIPETDLDVLRYTSSRAEYVPTVFTYIDKSLRLNNRYNKSLRRIKNYETRIKTQMGKYITT